MYKTIMTIVIACSVSLALLYYIYIMIRLNYLQKMFLTWNERLRKFLDNEIQGTPDRAKIKIRKYYNQFYLYDVTPHVMKFRKWSIDDFVEDKLLLYEVEKYYNEREKTT